MSDIFISYSRKDSAQAEQLGELLSSAGLSVWIDKQGIDLATSWSGEIVDAIASCTAFLVLLSSNSVTSENVVREVALASARKKKILPLNLEPVQLSRDLEYHLAGIQRAPMTNIDAVIRALGKLGLEAASAPTIQLVKEMDARKSLMVLPFEDLSPTGDNEWFADGLASELITAFSAVKSIRVASGQATKEYKKYNGQLTAYARTMNIRYFVQGDVRKFGDTIKITSRLLDIETGDHLWQDSMKGTMDDIFSMQEKVAENVVEGLKVHLASDEKKKLADGALMMSVGTANAEAYELYLKAKEYFDRQTKEGFQLAIQLSTEAIKLDPLYANAYQFKALALANLYRGYIGDSALLDEGMALVREALRLKPDHWKAYNPLSFIYQLQGKLEEAEAAAMEFVRNAPENDNAHFTLGFFYINTGQNVKAIAPLERAVQINPNNHTNLFGLVICCNGTNEETKERYWASVAIPLYERHMKLFPVDENARVEHALLLHCAGRDDDAREAAKSLEQIKDGNSLYNVACLHCMLHDYDAGIRTVRKALDAGFRNFRILEDFFNSEEGVLAAKGTPEYEEVRERVEKLRAVTKANA